MICPVEIASEVSALQAARVGDHGRHGDLHAGRSGASDESTGSDFCGLWRRKSRGGKQPRSSGSATGRCGAGGSVMKSSVSGVCLTGGGGSRRPSGGQGRGGGEVWGCIGGST